MLRSLNLSSFLKTIGVHWASYLVAVVGAMTAVVVCVNTISERGSTLNIYPSFEHGIDVVLIAAYLALVFAPMDFTIRKVIRRFAGGFIAQTLGLTISLSVLAAIMLGSRGATEVAMLGTLCFAIGGLAGGLTRAILVAALPEPAG